MGTIRLPKMSIPCNISDKKLDLLRSEIISSLNIVSYTSDFDLNLQSLTVDVDVDDVVNQGLQSEWFRDLLCFLINRLHSDDAVVLDPDDLDEDELLLQLEQLSCPHVTSRKDLKSLKNKMLLLDFLLKKKVISDQRFEIKSINDSVIKASGLFQGFNKTFMKASEEQNKKVEEMKRTIIEKDTELRKNIADKDRLELKLATSEEGKQRKIEELELNCARKVKVETDKIKKLEDTLAANNNVGSVKVEQASDLLQAQIDTLKKELSKKEQDHQKHIKWFQDKYDDKKKIIGLREDEIRIKDKEIKSLKSRKCPDPKCSLKKAEKRPGEYFEPEELEKKFKTEEK